MRQLIADLGSKATNTTLGLVKGSDDINVLESGELQLDTNYDTVEVNTAANIASITRGAKFKKILGNIVGALRGIDESVAQLNSNLAKVATITRATMPDITVAEGDVIMNFTLYDGTWLVVAYADGNKILIQDNAAIHQSYKISINPIDFVTVSGELDYQMVNKSGSSIRTYADGSRFYLIGIRIK